MGGGRSSLSARERCSVLETETLLCWRSKAHLASSRGSRSAHVPNLVWELNVSGWRVCRIADRHLATELIMPLVLGVGASSAIGYWGSICFGARKVLAAIPASSVANLHWFLYFVIFAADESMATLIAQPSRQPDNEITALQLPWWLAPPLLSWRLF